MCTTLYLQLQGNIGNGGQWGTPTTITPAPADLNSSPQINVQCNGQAQLVWSSNTGPRLIYQATYDPITGWSSGSQISTPAGDSKFPDVATPCLGPVNPIDVWAQQNGIGPWSIQTNYPTATTLFTAASGEIPQFLKIVGDCNGNATVVFWTSNSPVPPSASYNIYQINFIGGTWQPATTLATYNSDTLSPSVDVAFACGASHPVAVYTNNGVVYASNSANPISTGQGAAADVQIAFDCKGNAFAVWDFFGTSSFFEQIFAARYNGTSWATQTSLNDDTQVNGFNPQVAFDCKGNAICVWWDQFSLIFAKRYDATTNSWANNSDALYSGTPFGSPKIAIDCNGNALAIWPDNSPGIGYARYDSTTSNWHVADLVVTTATPYLLSNIEMDCNGNAQCAWVNGTDINAATFNAVPKPDNVNAVASSNNIQLTWNAPTYSPAIQSYNIYRSTCSATSLCCSCGSCPDKCSPICCNCPCYDSTKNPPYATVTAPTTTYTDNSVTPGTCYRYCITCVTTINGVVNETPVPASVQATPSGTCAITSIGLTNRDCTTGNVTVTINFAGGTSPIVYQLDSTVQTDNPVFINVILGTHQITVTATGCSSVTQSFTVPGVLTISSITQDCATGTVTVNATGGITPLLYTLGTTQHNPIQYFIM